MQKFEDDIVSMFTETAPAARNWTSFGERWSLNEDEVLDVQSFYGLNFFDFPGIVGDRQALIAHVRAKSLRAFVAAGEHPAARNYSYYLENVGKLSVPEMAQALNLSEGQVYRELALLNISLADYFMQNEAALGDDTQAGRFARHAQNLENRGVTWDRIFSFRGTTRIEVEILRELFDEEKSYKEIAAALNKLAGDLNADDINIRTEQSVAAKIQSLGLAPMNRLLQANIAITPYGVVKQSGALVPMSAIEFIWDHRQMPIAWLASKLGAQIPSLQNFLKTQHLDGLMKLDDSTSPLNTSESTPIRSNLIISSPEEAKKIADRLAEKDAAILRLHRAIVEQSAIPSSAYNKATGTRPLDIALGTSASRFTGTGNYSKSGCSHARRLYDSRLEAMEQTLVRVDSNAGLNEDEKIRVKKILQDEVDNLKFEALSLTDQNNVAIYRLHQAIAKQGAIPITTVDKATGRKPIDFAIGTGISRFTGTSTYSESGPLHHLRLNDSRLDAMEQTLSRVDLNRDLNDGEKISVKKILQNEIDRLNFEALPLADQNAVAISRLHQAIAKQGAIPSSTPDKTTGKIPLETALGMGHQRFAGTGDYAKNKTRHSYRLNDSRLEAMQETLARVDSNSDLSSVEKTKITKLLQAEIDNIQFETLPLAEQNDVYIRRLHQAIAKQGAIPTIVVDKTTGNVSLETALGTSAFRFTGTGEYAKNQSQHHRRLNDSRLDAMEQTLARVDSNPDLTIEQKVLVKQVLEKEIVRSRKKL